MLCKNIEVRRLGLSELELLLSLRMEVLAQVFSAERQEMSERAWNTLRENNRRYYLAELERGGHIACVAEIENSIAGCGGVCLYDEMPSPDNPSGKCAYLMNIYTRENFRGRGVASAVCEWLIAQAEIRSAGKIYLESTDVAKSLYATIGFAEMENYLKLERGGRL